MREVSVGADSSPCTCEDLPPTPPQKDLVYVKPPLGSSAPTRTVAELEAMFPCHGWPPALRESPSKGAFHLSFGDYLEHSNVPNRCEDIAPHDKFCSPSMTDSASPHQSLLPPFPENLAYSNRSHPSRGCENQIFGSGTTFQTCRQRPLLNLKPASHSDASVSDPLGQAKKLSSPVAKLRHSPSGFLASEPSFTQVRKPATPLSSCSTVNSSCSTASAESSLSCSDGRSGSVAIGSPLSALTSNDSAVDKNVKDSDQAGVTQFVNVASSVHGQPISLPLPPAADLSNVPQLGQKSPKAQRNELFDGFKTERVLALPGRVQSPEVSAFDFDSEDDGPSHATRGLRKLVSRPHLKASRSPADTSLTVPVAHKEQMFSSELPSRLNKDASIARSPSLKVSNQPNPSGNIGLVSPSTIESPSAQSKLAKGHPVRLRTPTPLHNPHRCFSPSTSAMRTPVPFSKSTRPQMSHRAFSTTKLQSQAVSDPRTHPRPKMPGRGITAPTQSSQRTLDGKGFMVTDTTTACQHSPVPPQPNSARRTHGASEVKPESMRAYRPAHRLRKLYARLIGKEPKQPSCGANL